MAQVLAGGMSLRIRGVTIMCYINLRFTYLLTYLLPVTQLAVSEHLRKVQTLTAMSFLLHDAMLARYWES